MDKKKKGRKPKFKTVLLNAGYIYKPKTLTLEERKQIENGIPISGKEGAKMVPPDYFYYYKMIDDVEVKIYCVGPDYYYNGVKLKNADQLPLIEKHAQENKIWQELDALVEDTKPNSEVNNLIQTKYMPDIISLKGGPLNGQQRVYNKGFIFFMEQIEIKGIVQAHRYKRDNEDNTLYHHQDIF